MPTSEEIRHALTHDVTDAQPFARLEEIIFDMLISCSKIRSHKALYDMMRGFSDRWPQGFQEYLIRLPSIDKRIAVVKFGLVEKRQHVFNVLLGTKLSQWPGGNYHCLRDNDNIWFLLNILHKDAIGTWNLISDAKIHALLDIATDPDHRMHLQHLLNTRHYTAPIQVATLVLLADTHTVRDGAHPVQHVRFWRIFRALNEDIRLRIAHILYMGINFAARERAGFAIKQRFIDQAIVDIQSTRTNGWFTGFSKVRGMWGK
jgi:hypothetical protein